jgi:hypothetical protein
MAGGTYATGTRLTNAAGMWMGGYGTISPSGALVNQGTILANNSSSALVVGGLGGLYNSGMVQANNGRMLVNGIFTNAGTLSLSSGTATFEANVVNQGAWVSDWNSRSVFDANSTFLVTSNGYVRGADGSDYVFRGDVVNQSTNNVLWNTLNMTPSTNRVEQGTQFLFAGSGVGQTQEFFHAGLLLTGGFTGVPVPLSNGVQNVSGLLGSAAGFVNNFALGQLELTNTTLLLEQAVTSSATTNALFVNDLFFLDNSHLVIGDNMRLYFVNSNGWDMANITLLGNAQIHQLEGGSALLLIPEPQVVMFWLCSAVTLYAARRRKRQ